MSDDDPGSGDGLSGGSDVDDVRVAAPAAENAPGRAAAARRRRLLGFIGLGLGIGAAIVALVQLVSASTTGRLLALGLAVAGVVCGAVALERREHRSWALWAVSLAGVAGVFAIAGMLPQADLEGHVYGYASGPTPGTAQTDQGTDASGGSTAVAGSCPELPDPPANLDAGSYYGAMYAADLDEKTTADPAVLAFEQPVRLASTATGADVMSMTASAPIDITEAAVNGSVDPPVNGVYLAVKVAYTNPADPTFACFHPRLPTSWWVTDAGDQFDLATVSVPDYPTLEDGAQPTADGGAFYYDIFDVSPQAAANGKFRIVLLAPDLTQQIFYWGAVTQ